MALGNIRYGPGGHMLFSRVGGQHIARDCGGIIYKLTDCESVEDDIYTTTDMQEYLGNVVSWIRICWIVSLYTDIEPVDTVELNLLGIAEFDDCEDCLASYTLTPCNIDCPNTEVGDCGGGAVVYTYAYRSGLQPSDATKVVKASVGGVTKCYTVAAGHAGSPTFSDISISGRYDDCENTEHTGCCDPCYQCGDCEYEGINTHSTITAYFHMCRVRWTGTDCTGTKTSGQYDTLESAVYTKTGCNIWENDSVTRRRATNPTGTPCSGGDTETSSTVTVKIKKDCSNNKWYIDYAGSGYIALDTGGDFLNFGDLGTECDGGEDNTDSCSLEGGFPPRGVRHYHNSKITVTDECDSGAVG